VPNNNNPFRLNVGFLIHQTVGYHRDFPFDFSFIRLQPDLDLTNLHGNVRITRTARGLLLQTKMKAIATTECVRCLGNFTLPLDVDFTDVYAFSPNSVTDSGLILPENGIIDLEQVMREEMLLSFPINPKCDLNCQGLCPICGENRNEIICNHEDNFIDPRLNKLKSLLDES